MILDPARRPRVAVFGYLSLDTLSDAHGRVPDVPGGGALYAALGVLAAGGRPVLHAARPVDFPGDVLARIAALGVDLSGLVPSLERTRRARLATQSGDARTSPHHAERDWQTLTDRLAPRPPKGSEGLDAVILCPMPVGVALGVADGLDRSTKLVLDTSEAYAREGLSAFGALLARADVFAPSLAETRLLLPGVADDDAARALSRRVALLVQTRGPDGLAGYADGALVASRAATATRVVDTTGAGDATCGALAVAAACSFGLAETLDLASRVGARAVSGLGPAGLGLDPVATEGVRCA